jgi:hypothetical protein
VLCLRAHQVNYEVFTEEFCQSKGWSDWDRRSWRDLTKKPSIVLTDMPDYFQVRPSCPLLSASSPPADSLNQPLNTTTFYRT